MVELSFMKKDTFFQETKFLNTYFYYRENDVVLAQDKKFKLLIYRIISLFVLPY